MTSRLLSPGELEILTSVGYLVMKWNYAEYCARQILRMYVPEDSISDPQHLKLSSKQAKWIEDELRDAVLPVWSAPGDAYLRGLIDAYSSAREHRNQIIHGIWTTVGSMPASGLLFNSKPVDGKSPNPKFIALSDLRPLIEHFADLADFCREVMVAFDKLGALALNLDGTPVAKRLPPVIRPLAPPIYDTA